MSCLCVLCVYVCMYLCVCVYDIGEAGMGRGVDEEVWMKKCG